MGPEQTEGRQRRDSMKEGGEEEAVVYFWVEGGEGGGRGGLKERV